MNDSSRMEQDREPNIPLEVRTWNWSAFFLTFIWGIPHRIYLSLLVLIPVVGFFIPFVLGMKGNEWAWKNKPWKSIQEFQMVQQVWLNATLGVFLLIIVAALSFPLILGMVSLFGIENLNENEMILMENPTGNQIACVEESGIGYGLSRVNERPPILTIQKEDLKKVEKCRHTP